jgi:hypothetical protein
MTIDLDALRLALTASLALLLLMLLFRRLRHRAIVQQAPVANHAELLLLQVAYHPQRLQVRLRLFGAEEVTLSLLDEQYITVHTWPAERMPAGEHTLERMMDQRAGTYYFELRTASQRTERRFVVHPNSN